MERARSALTRPSGGGSIFVGEPGVGKTLLARTVLAEAAEGGDHTLWVVAAASGPSIPFGAFAPLVPEVGGGEGTRRSPFDLLQSLRRAVIESAGGKDLVIGVDDAHRLDEASATLLFQLVSTGSARTVLATRAGAPVADAIRCLWKEDLVDRIDVGPLGRDHSLEFAGSLLGGPLDGELGEALWRVSDGNPLYVRELVLAGLAAGRIVEEKGMWRLQGDLAVGPRLSELLHERLGRLSPLVLSSLEVVAFADPIPLDVLTRLVPSNHIATLQRQRLLTVEPSHDHKHVRPAHPLYGEVIRAGLPATRVTELCLKLADAFEATGRLATNLLRVVSWRLEAGSVSEPALLLQAGQRAAERQDWTLAVRLAEAAAAAGPEAAAAAGPEGRRRSGPRGGRRSGPGGRRRLGRRGRSGVRAGGRSRPSRAPP